jgi:hypothetical protein
MKINITILLLFLFLEGKCQKVVFYLHGKIVENLGPNAVETANGFGSYKYFDILDSLKKENFVVISELRSINTNVREYAETVAKQIDSLLKNRVEAGNITVIGASKGSLIAMHVSSLLKNESVNFVFMAACSDDIFAQVPEINFYGNVLSIYEKSDSPAVGSCIKFKNRSKNIKHYKEIGINTGLRHGFLYRPIAEWMGPAVMWAKGNYD